MFINTKKYPYNLCILGDVNLLNELRRSPWAKGVHDVEVPPSVYASTYVCIGAPKILCGRP